MKKVKTCQAIVEEYLEQGLTLTLRQLYYQFVARGLLENTERSYKNLGNTVSKARLAGLLDWDAIEDRGRQPDIQSQWNGLTGLVRSASLAYRLPRWKGQEYYVELWVEKEALAGVLEQIASDFHVTLMVNKGYSSQSAMYASANRLMDGAQREARELPVLVFYLGDHDPSGEDMVRDIADRLNMFTGRELDLEVRKLALTTEQIEEYQPPPNPTKGHRQPGAGLYCRARVRVLGGGRARSAYAAPGYYGRLRGDPRPG
ncbi:MAG: hypothetical protein KAJ19_20695 [Gammaproteobacteria bacterium]|nr:hypothetical protein [Gammaproteobacteria bacterium]